MAGALNSISYRPIDAWPGEFTKHRKSSPFSSEFRHTIRLLSDEVDHLTDPRFDTLIVVQVAVSEREIRKDGTGLLAHVRTEHPGVIVSFESDHAGPLRFSCDRFDDGYRGKAGWRENLRAIALGLEALRKVDRYGIGTGAEQYRGFGALPPATPMGAAAMTIEQAARLLAETACEVGAVDLLLAGDRDAIRRCFRQASAVTHPDQGGDADEFRRIVEARDLLVGTGSAAVT